MAKFNCRCGEIIRMSGDLPNPIEWRLLPESAFYDDEGRLLEDAYMGSPPLYRCDQCERVFIFWSGFEGPGHIYRPDGVVT
jgi:hypothetical protein